MSTELSLDEYIRMKASDQFALLNHRRRDRSNEISEEELDNSLEQYIRDARVGTTSGSSSGSSTPQNTKKVTGNGKFDRKSMRSDEESDEDDDPLNKTLVPDDDVEMEDKSKEKAEEEDSLDDLLQFQTVESRYGIRVRSQQWRMLPENLVDRPEGVQRLECLPLDEDERYKRVQTGRIQKHNRSRASSYSSNYSKRSDVFTPEGIRAQGKFVEKGSFTYKTGDRNGDGREGIIGIERVKKITPPEPVVQNPTLPQVNINMNWDGFFQGMKQHEQAQPPPPPQPTNAEDKLAFAASNLLKLVQSLRGERLQKIQMQDEIEEIQGRPLVTKRQEVVNGAAYVDRQGESATPKYHRHIHI